jgi:hypothetical protein
MGHELLLRPINNHASGQLHSPHLRKRAMRCGSGVRWRVLGALIAASILGMGTVDFFPAGSFRASRSLPAQRTHEFVGISAKPEVFDSNTSHHVFLLNGRAGLGNRLYTLGHVLEYIARLNPNVELLVNWDTPNHSTFDGRFWDYFDLIGDGAPRHFHDNKLVASSLDALGDALTVEPVAFRGNLLRSVSAPYAPKLNDTTIRRFFQGTIDHPRTSAVAVHWDYCPSQKNVRLYSVLELNSRMRELVRLAYSTSGLFDGPYISMHVRNTDRRESNISDTFSACEKRIRCSAIPPRFFLPLTT